MRWSGNRRGGRWGEVWAAGREPGAVADIAPVELGDDSGLLVEVVYMKAAFLGYCMGMAVKEGGFAVGIGELDVTLGVNVWLIVYMVRLRV